MRGTATIYRAHFASVGGYGIEAYGATEAEARALLVKAARKFARQNGFTLEPDPLDYYGANVSPVIVGAGFVEGSTTPIVGGAR